MSKSNTQFTSCSRKRTAVIYLPILLALIVFFALPSSLPTSFASSSGYIVLCPSLPNGDYAMGVHQAPGGALVMGYSGNLYFCGGGYSKLITRAPNSGTKGYWGMGSAETKAQGLVLALNKFVPPFGFYLCYHASVAGCGSKSAFIPLKVPSCCPYGTVLDSSLNLYYVNPELTSTNTMKFVECTAQSNYRNCFALPASKDLSEPVGLYLSGSTFYIDGLDGVIYKGTTSSLKIIGDSIYVLDSITVSNDNPSKTPHVYVGIGGHILDLIDQKYLPAPAHTFYLPSLDSSLQFTCETSAVFQTMDSS
jgi:hypothetical protein